MSIRTWPDLVEVAPSRTVNAFQLMVAQKEVSHAYARAKTVHLLRRRIAKHVSGNPVLRYSSRRRGHG